MAQLKAHRIATHFVLLLSSKIASVYLYRSEGNCVGREGRSGCWLFWLSGRWPGRHR